MNSRQYTIRSIPIPVDRALRNRARRTGASLNKVITEAIAKGLGLTSGNTFDDLDWFIGAGRTSKQEYDSQTWLDSAPKEIK